MQHTSKQHFDFDGELAGNHSIAIEVIYYCTIFGHGDGIQKVWTHSTALLMTMS